MLRKINELLKPVKLVNLTVDVETVTGKKESISKVIKANKISQLSGSGLTALNLYELQKKKETVSKDQAGTIYTWKIGEAAAARPGAEISLGSSDQPQSTSDQNSGSLDSDGVVTSTEES